MEYPPLIILILSSAHDTDVDNSLDGLEILKSILHSKRTAKKNKGGYAAENDQVEVTREEVDAAVGEREDLVEIIYNPVEQAWNLLGDIVGIYTSIY